jgi:hypothetical protein
MLKALSDSIDFLLGLIMWPLAAAVIYYYSDIFSLFATTASSFITNASPIYLAGAVFFLFFRFNLLPFVKFPKFWNFNKGKYTFASRLDTWEHEFNHWFFAILTFKPGSSFKTFSKPNELGHAGYMWPQYGSNWLITIGPYFFPTFTFLLLPLILIPYEPLYPFLQFLLGWSISFHIVQNIVDVIQNWKPEVEGSFTDLTTLTVKQPNQTTFSIYRSWMFAILMIPALNFVVFTYILKVLQRNF